MSDRLLNTLVGLQPKWTITFQGSHASLTRPVNQPIFDDDPDGLVIFGDSSAIYLARVANPGQGPYTKLPSIKATTFIHGWALDAGNLYVVDGVELSVWNLGDAVKRHTLKLVADDDVTTAIAALAELKKAIQCAEWAMFLEQAEDELARLTTPSSDYVRMVEALRGMVGCANTSSAARQKIADLRKTLADKRKAAAPWCFSPPVVRLHAIQEPQTSVYVMQGNGVLHACDKQLGSPKQKAWGSDRAELYLALLDERTSAPERLAYVAGSTVYVIDARTLDAKGHWAPTTAAPEGTTRSLVAANGQFWWSTDNEVYACKPDETSVQLTWRSGPPWKTRQVGRLGVPLTNYNPSPDPNELFESINVHAWFAQRSDKTAPLNDGMAAQLMLSDEHGKYVAPPAGTTRVLYGPFGSDAVEAGHSWGEVSAHPSRPLVLLSGSDTASILCTYPTPCELTQLLPQWVVAPWLSSVTRGSAADLALSQPWSAPAVRPLSKPQPNMIKYFHESSARYAIREYEFRVELFTKPSRSMGDRELRYVLWWALFDHPIPDLDFRLTEAAAKKVLLVFYNDAQIKTLRERFSGLGTAWDYWGRTQEHVDNFSAAKPEPDFDPPWLWKARPSLPLFHKPPPRWYDPWGYNRPGDFVTQQPSPTYLDPFCFDGHLRFPQRPVTLETKFKGQQWAIFAENDSSIVIRTDEDQKVTTVYRLPAKPLGVTYTAATHELHSEALPYGSITDQVLGPPGFFDDALWCVGSREFPPVRLHKIVTVESGKDVSPWDTFVDHNKAQYGPSGGGTAWKIEACPLPSDVLPSVVLFGYLLAAPQ